MINHSFAVMAYKDSPYLSECLDSLKNQTVKSRIYITTSTPSDYISSIAKQYAIELFVSDTWNGMAEDWNFAFNHGTTKYITLVHQDDIYLPGYTELCCNAAEKFQDTLICFTDYLELTGSEERSANLLLKVKRLMFAFFMPLKKNINNRFWKKSLLALGDPIAAPSVMFNREKLSNFLFSSEFSINIDWDAWQRMALMEGRFVYVNKILLKHRIHSDSATTVGLKGNIRQQEDIVLFKRFWPGAVAKLLSRIYARSYKSNEF